MSARHRSPAATTGSDSGSTAIEPLADRTAGVPTGRSRPADRRPRTPLERRIERVRLRARVAALERALVDQRRRRQALVDRYELLLEERDRNASDGRDDRSIPDRFARLRRRLRDVTPSFGTVSPAP